MRLCLLNPNPKCLVPGGDFPVVEALLLVWDEQNVRKPDVIFGLGDLRTFSSFGSYTSAQVGCINMA